ncbi:hypothetical protein BS50DRAFT_198419 [Corynespora cassiicola Philippines]|uniref:C2H2-type domain-containing protein n=1 Tax=Corynespora cassiicola Philippines TaxID=1448308 RepID=A0A2T2N606_CORCC|nr:hypothetical protein BS50DRAFT_198419 [Corynespora cassiicola Philippines]
MGNPLASSSNAMHMNNNPDLRPPVSRREPKHDMNMPNIALLAPPSHHPPRQSVPSAGADPMSRFYNDPNGPWSSERTRNSSMSGGRSSYSQPQMDFGPYRSGPSSDSVMSDPEPRVEQEFPSEVLNHFANVNLPSASSDAADPFRQSETGTQYSSRSRGSKEFTCSKCLEVSKCQSDYKKHMLKHNKPYVCDISNCRRNGRGFTTVNDLARHKKSVHRIDVSRNSYQCASENCRNKEKIWPRLDNFKQHIARMHKEEDEQDLIRRSAYRFPEPSANPDTMSVAPLDTTLAGIGTEKQFPGNDFDDPTPGISLTPDQDPSLWNSFVPTSHDFAMDVDQSNQSLLQPGPRTSDMDSAFKFPGQPSSFDSSHTSDNLVRHDSLRTDNLANTASTQPSQMKEAPHSPVELSSLPQTKADQQRQALQKLSKIISRDIQNPASGEPVDLERALMRALYRATSGQDDDSPQDSSSSSASPDYDDGTVLTKSEAIKASQAISNLIKQSGRPIPQQSRPRRLSKGFPSPNTKTCEKCGITLARSCDLKKHMKRHTKPYGCTYPKCHKRFGAKSDWKRHENSQHFQLEAFRCHMTSPLSQTPCGELFYRPELFKTHLQQEHKMTQTDRIDHELKARRIGKNGQGQFWCGFCQVIVKLEKKRNAAWDERFDHIDMHFSKEKKGIEDWLCVEAKKFKGETFKDVDRLYEDEDTDSVEMNDPPSQPAAPTESSVASMSMQAIPQDSRKRSAPFDSTMVLQAAKRYKKEKNRYCCHCQGGPWSTSMYPRCIDCQHDFCDNCVVVDGSGLNVEAEMGMMG